jgi:hypothetical protein
MIGEQQVIQSVRVTNTNDFKIVDRFDGVPYEFLPGAKGVAIPIDAAYHIFGWMPGATEEQIFAHTQRRFGWNTPAMVASGVDRKFFGRIKIEPVVYKLVEVVPDDQPEPETPDGEGTMDLRDEIPPPKRTYRKRATEMIDERIAEDRAEADRETARRLQEHIDQRIAEG